jgi:rhodanese-related sulfurtransferase
MKTRSMILALALVVCGATVGARAQGDGQNLPRVTLDEFKQLLASNAVVVLDVRSGVIDAKIKGAAHIQEADLQSHLKELPRDREIITYCA